MAAENESCASAWYCVGWAREKSSAATPTPAAMTATSSTRMSSAMQGHAGSSLRRTPTPSRYQKIIPVTPYRRSPASSPTAK